LRHAWTAQDPPTRGEITDDQVPCRLASQAPASGGVTTRTVGRRSRMTAQHQRAFCGCAASKACNVSWPTGIHGYGRALTGLTPRPPPKELKTQVRAVLTRSFGGVAGARARPGGLSVNPSRKLRRFESFTCHPVHERAPDQRKRRSQALFHVPARVGLTSASGGARRLSVGNWSGKFGRAPPPWRSHERAGGQGTFFGLAKPSASPANERREMLQMASGCT
jgi:hypothetical protein